MASELIMKLVSEGRISPLWLKLTRDLIKEQFDPGSYSRGDTYQKDGQVEEVSVHGDQIDAEVWGTDLYNVSVEIHEYQDSGKIRLISECSCPVEMGCKHSVAVLLEMMINGPGAIAGQPRSRNRSIAKTAKGKPDNKAKSGENPKNAATDNHPSDASILAHLKAKPTAQLADYTLELLRRLPDEYQKLREKVALDSSDTDALVALIRDEISRQTLQLAKNNFYDPNPKLPDYTKLNSFLERLLQAGRADDVLKFAEDAMQQLFFTVYRIQGRYAIAKPFAICIPLIQKALQQSSLSPLQKLEYWMTPIMGDIDNELIDVRQILKPSLGKPPFWSSVADTLQKGLEKRLASARVGTPVKHVRRGVDAVVLCLQRAKRDDDITKLYRLESKATNNNDRLLKRLMETGKYDEARAEILSGRPIGTWMSDNERRSCLDRLAELAEHQKNWAAAAGVRSVAFFAETPKVSLYLDLIQAAEKAGKRDETWAAVKKFLQTNELPFRKVDARTREAKLGLITNKSDWPLPIPDELWVLIPKSSKSRADEEDLLRFATAGEHLEDLIEIYDRLRDKEKNNRDWFPALENHLDRVAKTLSNKMPQKSVEYYMEALQLKLQKTGQEAYSDCATYLVAMHPLFVTMRMESQWHDLVRSLREAYPKRRTFLEILDFVEQAINLCDERSRST